MLHCAASRIYGCEGDVVVVVMRRSRRRRKKTAGERRSRRSGQWLAVAGPALLAQAACGGARGLGSEREGGEVYGWPPAPAKRVKGAR